MKFHEQSLYKYKMAGDLIGYKLNGQLEDHWSTEHKYQPRQDKQNFL